MENKKKDGAAYLKNSLNSLLPKYKGCPKNNSPHSFLPDIYSRFLKIIHDVD